ncbi:MAG: MBL fold metallo-hydrolase [bacterium]|nr:MBL fold metallo-hydrolase [bacterium]
MKHLYPCIGIVSLALFASGCASSGWKGPVSDHFNGKRFTQPEPHRYPLKDWLKIHFASHRGKWQKFRETPPGPPPPRQVDGGALRVTFVNHATMLIQMDGINILTDPTWAKRSVSVVGAHRRRSPGLRYEDLPPIDAVIVSHNHHDHMDIPTLRWLSKNRPSPVYSGIGNTTFLKRKQVSDGHDIDWWESVTIAPGITLTAVPARHTSGRFPPLDQNRTLWCGFVITGPSGSVYFAGDTGWGLHFEAIAKRFPHLRLAFLPIGGFKPIWHIRQQHIGPADVMLLGPILNASTVIPMHFGTFPNGEEAQDEAPELLRTLGAENPEVGKKIIILDNGESVYVPAYRP